MGPHRYLALTLVTVFSDLSRCNPSHNLCQCQAALLPALAQTPQQRAQELALLCQALLVILCLQAPAEAAL